MPLNKAVELANAVLDHAVRVAAAERRIVPDGGWSRQGAILVSNIGELVLYLRDRTEPGAQIEDVELAELQGAIDRIGQFVVST